MATLVNTRIVFLVVLGVDLLIINFVNAKITVITIFAKFIGKNFGLTFHTHRSDQLPL